MSATVDCELLWHKESDECTSQGLKKSKNKQNDIEYIFEQVIDLTSVEELIEF